MTLSGVPGTATVGGTFTAVAGGGTVGAYSYAVTGTACTVNSSTGAGTVDHVSGGCSVTASRAGDSDYNVATSAASAITTINKANQANVTLSGVPGTATVGDAFTAVAGGGSGTGAYSYAVTGTACTVNPSTGAGSVLHVSGGCSVTATRAADSDYNVATSAASAITTINKANQATVTLSGVPGTAAVGDTFTAVAGGGSGTGAYSYAVTGTACTVNPSTGAGTVDQVSGGCSVTASRAADSDYNVATSAASAITTINKADQATLTAVVTPSTVTFGSTAALTSTGGSGSGLVSFSAGASTGCSVAGSTLSITDASGTCSVTATKAADSSYNAATSAAAPVTMNKATQAAVTVTAPATATVGQTGLSAAAAGGSGSGAYSYSSSTPAVCSVNASSGALTISATGSCSITATRATDNNYLVSATSPTPAVVSVGLADQATLTAVVTPSTVTFG
ncbi:MAG: hypothetical protein ACOYB4_10955, partial [Methyloceanibacter sp.]